MTIKVKNDLWAKIAQAAEAAGYSSPEEFVEHVLEKEIARIEEAPPEDEVERRLKGLGYID